MNAEDLAARTKDFRKVQLICFFGTLLPLFLVCTIGWLLAAIVTCRKAPGHLSASNFAEDVVAASTISSTDLTVSDMSLVIDNQITALLTLCGYSCAPSSSNTSNNFLYSMNDSLVDKKSYKREVLLKSSSVGFQCDYIVSNVNLDGYLSRDSTTTFSMTSGKAAAANITLTSVPMLVSLSLQSSVSSLQVQNHSRSINASLFGPVYMESVSGDILVTNSTEFLAMNVSSSNITVYTTGRASIYWTNSTPAPVLQSLTLLVAYNATTTAGPYLICMPIDALMQANSTPLALSLTNRGLSGSVTLTYYEHGQAVSSSEASLTTIRCNSFDIQYQETLYTVTQACQFGTINVVITQSVQPGSSDNAIKVMTVHNNGQVDLHLYRANDELPDLCAVQPKIL